MATDTQVFAQLKQSFSNLPDSLPELSKLVQEAMLILSKSGLLSLHLSAMNPAQATLLQETLEIAAYCAVYQRDGRSFERYISQLSPFYRVPSAAASVRLFSLLGLHLLNLLVTNREAQFYAAVSKLEPSYLTDIHIAFVIQLHQCLQEGTYHRLVLARSQVPAPEYGWLVDSLMDTVRIELAAAIEKSYAVLDLASAAKLLLLSPEQSNIIADVAAQRGWKVDPAQKVIHFTLPDNKPSSETNSGTLIKRAIQYAVDLEVAV